MTETQQLLLRRKHLLEEAIVYYEDNNILKSKFYTKFENEIGEVWEVLPGPFFLAFGKGSQLDICMAQTSTYFVFDQESF